MHKQVIVLRKDLNMRKGKMITQGAHASLGAVFGLGTGACGMARVFGWLWWWRDNAKFGELRKCLNLLQSRVDNTQIYGIRAECSKFEQFAAAKRLVAHIYLDALMPRPRIRGIFVTSEFIRGDAHRRAGLV